MGSTGPGTLSDYPGYAKARRGVVGDSDLIDQCEKAVNTELEDVATSDYYKSQGLVPPVDTTVFIKQVFRIVAVDENGVIIGNLPTKYNYLLGCLEDGYVYEGQVSVSHDTPLPYVEIAVTPKKV